VLKRYSDNSLIEGIRLQDDKALGYAYKTYYQMVRNHVLKNSGDMSDVSEVLQESMIVLYKQITSGNLNLTTDLKGYFFGIARLVWNSLLRQKQKHSGLVSDITDESTPLYESDNVILERVVARAMEKLKPDCREVIMMFSEGVDYSTIAKKLSFSSEDYARRKKYLCREALMDLIRNDPEYRDHLDLK
jgi:RNA polymerase sigma factor (sigma-70 family)